MKRICAAKGGKGNKLGDFGPELAFTLTELVVLLAVGVLLLAVLWPARAMTRAEVSRMTCANNLKRIGVGMRLWADGKVGRYPIRVPNVEGGPPNQVQLASAVPDPGYTYQVFGVLSNYLQHPRFIVCPTDERLAHSNFTMQLNYKSAGLFLNNTDLSYFAGRDAALETPRMLLAGDRNIGANPNAIGYGYGREYRDATGLAQALGTNANSTISWTDRMHQQAGNVVFADGHVDLLDSAQLRAALSQTGDTSNPGPNYTLFP